MALFISSLVTVAVVAPPDVPVPGSIVISEDALTFTVQEAVNFPSAVVTVITAVPAPIPSTRPLPLTTATEVLLDDHVTLLFVASDGDTVAVIVPVLPAVRSIAVLSKDTPVTDITGAVIFIIIMPETDVSTVDVAVIIREGAVSPAATLSTPDDEILVAESLFPVTLHVTVCGGLLSPVTVAENARVEPFCTKSDEDDTATLFIVGCIDSTINVKVVVAFGEVPLLAVNTTV
jgi:hypothetical protein